jgi:hypothetical protein
LNFVVAVMGRWKAAKVLNNDSLMYLVGLPKLASRGTPAR